MSDCHNLDDGLVPDELLPSLPHGFEHDPETGRTVPLRSVRPVDRQQGKAEMGEPFYMHISPSLSERVSVRGYDPDDPTLVLVSGSREERAARCAEGSTELERFALFHRQPKYSTDRAMEKALCAFLVPPNDTRVSGIPAKVLDRVGENPVLRHLAWLVLDQPERGSPSLLADLIFATTGTIDSIARSAPRDCYEDREFRRPGYKREQTVGEVAWREVLGYDGPEGYVNSEAVCEYLQELLAEPWSLAALADVGVRVELEGDRVQMIFVDPCHAHRARLGRESL